MEFVRVAEVYPVCKASWHIISHSNAWTPGKQVCGYWGIYKPHFWPLKLQNLMMLCQS